MFAAGKTNAVSGVTYVDDVFNTYLYSGNSTTGGAQTITNGINLSGYGGMVWVKGRSAASQPIINDTERGVGTSATANKALTISQSPEGLGGTANDFISAFSTQGFSVTQGGTITTTRGTNYSGVEYVAYTFRKATGFFDVVTYTGSNTVSSRSHSLGAVPGAYVVKTRNRNNDGWFLYHRSLGATGYVQLENNDGFTTGGDVFGGVSPTATTFNVRAGVGQTNNAGDTYVCYLFGHDTSSTGLIQCGSYTGNGSATGPSISLGWEPQFLIIKNSSANSTAWYLLDTTRGMVVGNADSPFAGLGVVAETSATLVTPTSTGFQINTTIAALNSLGATYIYIAIRRPNKPPTAGTEVFQPTVYTGTNVNNRLVNTTIAPDMVWVRQRDDTVLSGLVVGDRLRGQPYLLTGSSNNEATSATAFDQQLVGATEYGTAFSAMNGFWVGTDATAKLNVNTTSNNHIAEAFKRAPEVFDVVCYTGNGVGGRTVAHNLQATPELMIVKGRAPGYGYYVYCGQLSSPGTKSLYLNLDAPPGTSIGQWNNTAPTASVFTVGPEAGSTNDSGVSFVAYLFASKAGISKIGSYTGNGGTVNTNGTSQTINCGFSAGARFVLIKRTDTNGNWYVFDSARGIVAASDPYLLTNSTAAEVTSVDAVDADNSGFIVNQTSGTNLNVTSATYIYLAYA